MLGIKWNNFTSMITYMDDWIKYVWEWIIGRRLKLRRFRFRLNITYVDKLPTLKHAKSKSPKKVTIEMVQN